MYLVIGHNYKFHIYFLSIRQYYKCNGNKDDTECLLTNFCEKRLSAIEIGFGKCSAKSSPIANVMMDTGPQLSVANLRH